MCQYSQWKYEYFSGLISNSFYRIRMYKHEYVFHNERENIHIFVSFFCLFHFLKYYYLICVFETNLCYFSFYREYLHKNKTEDRSWQFLNWLKRQINREIHFDIISLWSCNLCFKINQVFHFLLYFEYSILINDNPNCVVKNVISC